ncbi:MAG: CBS domain-containing protein [Lautropia sp.]
MQVGEILSLKGSTLFTASPDMMLSECVVTMAEQDIGSIVIMENGRLAGMLTFREVLKVLAQRQAEHRSGPTRPVAEIVVREVMVREPPIVTPATEVNELRRLMLETHTRYVPVMDGDTLMGIVSFHDVARAVLEEQSFENKMLKAYIRDWPAEG